ncbi:hypothetical protein MASR2M117_00120 [Paludibacter sp.]
MIKKLNIYLISAVLALLCFTSCDNNEVYRELDDDSLSIRLLVNKYHRSNSFYVGAQPGDNYLTYVQYEGLRKIFYQEFAVATLNREFYQQNVYPLPNKEWFNGSYKHTFDLARKNDQLLSITTALSPDCSEWIKDETDNLHTTNNINSILEYYIENIGKELENNKDVVKWMTVVSEPVSVGHTGLDYDGTGVDHAFSAGEWFGPVSGVGYENPWTVLGFSDIELTSSSLSEKRIPTYIVEAFQLSNKYAPGVKQLIAQSDDILDDAVWNTIKQMLLKLRDNNIKVDGMVWKASLDLTKGIDEESLRRLSLLIDWCYQNSFEFHITGLEVKSSPVNRWNVEDLDGLTKKEAAISTVLNSVSRIAIQKSGKGIATLSFGVFDGRYDATSGTFANLFSHDGDKRLMYYDLQKLLIP